MGGPIFNHFYWCSHTSIDNEALFKQKWESILHHVTNEHQWKIDNGEYSCSHAAVNL